LSLIVRLLFGPLFTALIASFSGLVSELCGPISPQETAVPDVEDFAQELPKSMVAADFFTVPTISISLDLGGLVERSHFARVSTYSRSSCGKKPPPR
jgi:hypothetical protein